MTYEKIVVYKGGGRWVRRLGEHWCTDCTAFFHSKKIINNFNYLQNPKKGVRIKSRTCLNVSEIA